MVREAGQPVAPQILTGRLHLPPHPRGSGETPWLKISQRQVHMLMMSPWMPAVTSWPPSTPCSYWKSIQCTLEPKVGPGPPSQALCRERPATVCRSVGPQMSPWLLHVHVGDDS